ncbi:Cyclic di-GMP phosphodiesterase [bioreactor metagenome]|uniref:Cyclic di-GMP phosphodiesterase n=1 Tax=bioreactor metagenome TaxID=1076179 RepID=A0A644UDN7_9ZZZZ|nr:HD-GYP domain-containing protein [Negativicutes bacterium]
MLKISITNLQPGMVIGHHIYNSDGLLLLNAGTELNVTFIKRLEKVGIGSVYIKNSFMEDLEIPEAIREETRQKAVSLVQKSFRYLQVNARINVEQFEQAADCIVDEIVKNRPAMVHLTDIRTHDNYTFGHSVNVCVLSTITGLQLGYNQSQLRTLALGALLHDTGKALVPLEILNKPSRLTDAEMSIMRTHTEKGFDLLRKQADHIPLLASHVAFQHHEKHNGCGYPRGLTGDTIHEYAKITAIADVYDAVTADRPYRERMPAHEAYELAISLANTHFDPAILTSFLSNIAIYPIGSFIVLNTGEIALVTNTFPNLPTRPCVKVITDADGKRLADPYLLDLTEQLTLFVSSVLSEKEVIELKLV